MEARAAQPLQDNRFLLLEAVGRGGMGSVYRAFDRADQQMVALKVLEQAERAGPAHPLSVEFGVWMKLRHPNIVKAYELRRARRGPLPPGTPYLVLEYFHGRPVHQVLPPGRCDSTVLEEFTRRVLWGLRHVHDAGLVHRDVKATNVLVGRARRGPGRVKLTDFGLSEPAGSRSEPGRLSGSLQYVAPETIVGGRIDGRSDLYGLGILLFLLATGRMAPPAHDPDSIISWHLTGSTPDPRTVRPDISERLARFIKRLTSRNRRERPASADEALFHLGDTPPRPRIEHPSPADRGRTARLRLALDAVRLGGRRLFVLPRERDPARSLIAEARLLADVHDVAFHRLSVGRGRGREDLGRLVLRQLLDEDERAAPLAARYGLCRRLPLDLLGGLPVWDRSRAQESDELGGERSVRAAARGVAAFLLEVSTRRALALHVDNDVRRDRLSLQVVRELAGVVVDRPVPERGRGGLLLLIDAVAARSCGSQPNRLERIS